MGVHPLERSCVEKMILVLVPPHAHAPVSPLTTTSEDAGSGGKLNFIIIHS